MEQFVGSLTAATSPMAVTENGATARSTTGSDVLNLFSQIGGLRKSVQNGEKHHLELVYRSYHEDPLLTARCVFYSRDVRGGQGERETFRQLFRELLSLDPEYKNLIPLIPFYGRWDDLVGLVYEAPEIVIREIKEQLARDIHSPDHSLSLMAKWLPSENASSKKTKELAKVIRVGLGLSPKAYRQTLTCLRERLNIVESKMSKKEWNDIHFPAVPSKAMLKYRAAFAKQAPEKFSAFLEAVKSGEEKINAGTLFPYELVGKYLDHMHISQCDEVVEAQWKALPNYFSDKSENSLVVCDVSGSMDGLPLNVSISLGLYVAERNKGIWHNKFMTFSSNPTIQSVVGETLLERVRNLNDADWSMNTNIELVFNRILETAVLNKIDPSEMIKRLYIVSDMEFDAASTDDYDVGADKTLFQTIREKFKQSGYEMPELVFWNVDSRNKQYPMGLDERGFLNVSGCSPSIFQNLLGKTFVTAHDLMLDVINGSRYQFITMKGGKNV